MSNSRPAASRRASGDKFADKKTIAQGLTGPVQMVIGQDGALYVTEAAGKLTRVNMADGSKSDAWPRVCHRTNRLTCGGSRSPGRLAAVAAASAFSAQVRVQRICMTRSITSTASGAARRRPAKPQK